ncbi:hypothetical protein [Pseudobacteriovorax antillogorgiicola]|uniref:Uncharacterized protein n=1 Tax=Pseudobacteriovorax antillogorgiicola TaxID=1513793 RepID=A0A1Y6BRJ8_9BACT|nr:hypothetical protein [Pseudobacteriovorax antillogorgiicola]TCS54703.1 hypothetical protein EDD56_106216 [Pseudobacteriovorax antillogorgiicola]SMF16284.1 hypothetical protein SAMN06296036_10627 [Pseudobacteriovorax antillogorgiicola]
MTRLIALFLATCFLTLSCGEEEEEEATGSIKISMTTTGTPSSSSLNLLSTAADFRNSSIASGAPDSMTIYIQKIALQQGSTGSPYTVFYDEAGKGIKVSSGKVDISQLFTVYECIGNDGIPVEGLECPCGLDDDDAPVEYNEDGTCPGEGTDAVGIAPASEGTYDYIAIDYYQRAKVTGCVTGNFSSTSDSGGADTQGERTYCTQESLHTFQSTQGAASASEFENVTAQEMNLQVSLGSDLTQDETETISYKYPLSESITVSADSSPTMTMVIDTNRMLRFYNQNVTQSINPGVPSDRSFFFNTVFDYSVFAFVGSPGDIRGFQWWTDACSGTVTADRLCADSGNVQTVAGWLTVVKDSSGTPLVAGFMPDDDNSWTIIKGSNKSADGLDADAFTADGANYNIGFSLGTDGAGTIYGANLDADLNSTQEITFEGLQSSYGKLYLNRQL